MTANSQLLMATHKTKMRENMFDELRAGMSYSAAVGHQFDVNEPTIYIK